MRKTGWAPSIVRDGDDQNVYLVMDDLGCSGRVWREADAHDTDLEAVIGDLLDGQYTNPLRVVGFNRDVPFFLQDFRRPPRGPLSRLSAALADPACVMALRTHLRSA
jgi:hypothetical protein